MGIRKWFSDRMAQKLKHMMSFIEDKLAPYTDEYGNAEHVVIILDSGKILYLSGGLVHYVRKFHRLLPNVLSVTEPKPVVLEFNTVDDLYNAVDGLREVFAGGQDRHTPPAE